MSDAWQRIDLGCRRADRGLFDLAVRACTPIGPSRREYAASRSLLASVYRQMGRHDLAEPYDRQGAAAEVPDPLGVSMCLLGLAADQVGAGDLDRARQALARAGAAVDDIAADHWARRWFDPWVTRAWVRAEVGLLADDPGAAVAALQPFARAARLGGETTRGPYQRAKTLLFLGVAQRGCGQANDAHASLMGAAGIAAQAGFCALLVVAADLLELWRPGQAAQWSPEVQRARGVMRAHRAPERGTVREKTN